MKKKLGARGVSLFKKNLSGKPSFLVEYFSTVSEDVAFANSQVVYKKTFNVEPERSDIVFKQAPHIG